MRNSMHLVYKPALRVHVLVPEIVFSSNKLRLLILEQLAQIASWLNQALHELVYYAVRRGPNRPQLKF